MPPAYNSPKLAQILLDSGAKVNLQDEQGWTALIWAGKWDEVVEVLVKAKGIDLNLKDKKGKTALMNASTDGHIKTAEILIKNKGQS